MFNQNKAETPQQQLEPYRKQFERAGFSGSGILDVQSDLGIIRLKLMIPPPADQSMIVQQLAQALVATLGGMNIAMKIHSKEDDDV